MIVFNVWLLIAILVAIFWPYFLTSSILKGNFDVYDHGRTHVFFAWPPIVINIFGFVNSILIALATCAYALSYDSSISLPGVHIGTLEMTNMYVATCFVLMLLITCNHIWSFGFFREHYFRFSFLIALCSFGLSIAAVSLLGVERLALGYIPMIFVVIWQLYIVVMNLNWWVCIGKVLAKIKGADSQMGFRQQGQVQAQTGMMMRAGVSLGGDLKTKPQ